MFVCFHNCILHTNFNIKIFEFLCLFIWLFSISQKYNKRLNQQNTNTQKVLNGKEPQTIQGFKMKMPPPTQTKKQTLHSKFLTCKWVRPTIMK